MDIDFLKMHGLGNDFVVFDTRKQSLNFSAETLQRIADRSKGIGCDQVLLIEPAIAKSADAFLRIYNADGTEAEACGNGTRCVAWWLGEELDQQQLTIQTLTGDLSCKIIGPDQVQVQMGQAKVIDSQKSNFVDVSLGNPHRVFFVSDCDQVDWQVLRNQAGDQVNVGAVQIANSERINLRVWERGAGLTQACGSGACAAVVAAHSRKLVSSSCQVMQPGGSLEIEVKDAGMVEMKGPVALSYQGTVNINALMS